MLELSKRDFMLHTHMQGGHSEETIGWAKTEKCGPLCGRHTKSWTFTRTIFHINSRSRQKCAKFMCSFMYTIPGIISIN